MIGRRPRRREKLVVVTRAITDQVSRDLGDTLLLDRVSQCFEGRLVDGRPLGVVAVPPFAREDRVTTSDEIEIAVDHAVDGWGPDHLGRVREAWAEHVECDRGRDDLEVAGGRQRKCFVLCRDLLPVDRQRKATVVADGLHQRLQGRLQRCHVDLTRQDPRRTAHGQQRCAHRRGHRRGVRHLGLHDRRGAAGVGEAPERSEGDGW